MLAQHPCRRGACSTGPVAGEMAPMSMVLEKRRAPRLSTARQRAQPVIDWLVEVARRIEGAPEFLEAICERIVAEGVPLERCTVHARTLHPEIFGFTVRWLPDRPHEVGPR